MVSCIAQILPVNFSLLRVIYVRFKMLLRPKTTSTTPLEQLDIPIPKLPPRKDIVAVYADFYKYMYECAKTYISQTEAMGDLVWESFDDNIVLVLSHPNGWGGAQQAAMHRAVVKAGLVPDNSDGRERVSFISEGEASLQFCLASGSSDDIKVSALSLSVSSQHSDTLHKVRQHCYGY
jgi:hypothetical protein